METVPSILVTDDEPNLRDSIRRTLETAGYRVLTASDGEKALALLESHPVDLILADVAMPGMNGYQLHERVREDPQWTAIPFVFLTARTLDSDIRFGKELGADDYLTKPIAPQDLLAAIRGKLRRGRQIAEQLAESASESQSLVVGKLRIDSVQHDAWLSGEPIHLSVKEFSLLEYLAQRVGQPVSPQELVQVTHDLDTTPGEAGSLLRPLVFSLRRKLGYRAGEAGCIENVRGVGYRLKPPVD
jgi:two-component system alkaline phosphatase synthesis response regulator PhoP